MILDQLLHFLLEHGKFGLFAYLFLLLFELDDTVLASFFVVFRLLALAFALGAFASFLVLLGCCGSLMPLLTVRGVRSTALRHGLKLRAAFELQTCQVLVQSFLSGQHLTVIVHSD